MSFFKTLAETPDLTPPSEPQTHDSHLSIDPSIFSLLSPEIAQRLFSYIRAPNTLNELPLSELEALSFITEFIHQRLSDSIKLYRSYERVQHPLWSSLVRDSLYSSLTTTSNFLIILDKAISLEVNSIRTEGPRAAAANAASPTSAANAAVDEDQTLVKSTP